MLYSIAVFRDPPKANPRTWGLVTRIDLCTRQAHTPTLRRHPRPTCVSPRTKLLCNMACSACRSASATRGAEPPAAAMSPPAPGPGALVAAPAAVAGSGCSPSSAMRCSTLSPPLAPPGPGARPPRPCTVAASAPGAPGPWGSSPGWGCGGAVAGGCGAPPAFTAARALCGRDEKRGPELCVYSVQARTHSSTMRRAHCPVVLPSHPDMTQFTMPTCAVCVMSRPAERYPPGSCAAATGSTPCPPPSPGTRT